MPHALTAFPAPARLNKTLFEKLGGNEPETFDEFNALLDKAKAAGVTPLALGGQPWQEATMFDSVVASTGGVVDHHESTLKSDTMKKAFENLAKLRNYTDKDYVGRDWKLATAMVIKGDALVQVIGDWAKGEFGNANKEAGRDFVCSRRGSSACHACSFARTSLAGPRSESASSFSACSLAEFERRPSPLVRASGP